MDSPSPAVSFETDPSRYKHWKLSFDGPIATLAMNVKEDAGLKPDYQLKLNSYDLGVDIELADAVERIRFEHPEVRCVVVTSLKDKIFCAGANIFMLGTSTHAWKVNFCKFTNETRLGIEDASSRSGIRFLCALNGTASGGGYELALACDEIHLIDDGNSAVSLPEVPLLGVLPGTGGLTRVVDKRKVRRDRADVFCTVSEGLRGDRAVEWGLVDQAVPRSRFAESIAARAKQLAESSPKAKDAKTPILLPPVEVKVSTDAWTYANVTVKIDRTKRCAEVTVSAPSTPQAENPEGILSAGSKFWALAAFRELNDAILKLRFLEPEIGLLVLKTRGNPKAVLQVDATLAKHKDHWAVKEITGYMARTLKRLDVTSRSAYALVDGKESCFAGSLFELALVADRVYMLDDEDGANKVQLSPMNNGLLPMGNGLSRLQTRFWGSAKAEELLENKAGFDAAEAEAEGLCTFIPDDIDWDDEVRLAIEERAAMSPDALTGMEASLRWPGPETMETKIFARLTAWQNWIFQRPNAVGEKGALKVYGKAGQKPEFDFKRV
jgi:benzoyl-CoA-dihydrodiol lyase